MVRHMISTGSDSDRLLRLLENGQKSKYFNRTVKLLQVTPIKQSNIQVIAVQTFLQKSLKYTYGFAPGVIIMCTSSTKISLSKFACFLPVLVL